MPDPGWCRSKKLKVEFCSKLSGVCWDFFAFFRQVCTSSCQMRGSPVTFCISSCTQLSSSGGCPTIDLLSGFPFRSSCTLLNFKLERGVPHQWPFPKGVRSGSEPPLVLKKPVRMLDGSPVWSSRPTWLSARLIIRAYLFPLSISGSVSDW